MREPTEPGTVVLLSNGEALLLVEPKWPCGWWNLTIKAWQGWSEFSDLVPSIVRHGYTPPPPPTPEPTLPYAIVQDAEDAAMIRGRDGHWYVVGGKGVRFSWAAIEQHAKILFPGVPDA